MLNKEFTLASVTGNVKYLENYIKNIDKSKRFDTLISLIFDCQNFLMDDKLSNVYTRKSLNVLYDIYKDQSENIAISFMDINGLRKINETYTVTAGDRVIAMATSSLNRAMEDNKKECSIVRMGGDEFVIITKDTSIGEIEKVNQEAHSISDKRFGRLPYNADWEEGTVMIDEIEHEYFETDDKGDILRTAIKRADIIANNKKQINKDEEKKKNAMKKFLDILDGDATERTKKLNYVGFDKGEIEGKYTQNLSIFNKEVLKMLLKSNDKFDLAQYLQEYKDDNEELIKIAHNVGMYCMQDREHIVSRNCSNAIGSIINGNLYKSIYFEVKNLKIINEANNHDGGDKYINDALGVLTKSISLDEENIYNPNIILRISGNGFFAYVKSEELDNTISNINKNIDEYNSERATGPKLDAYVIPLEEKDEYANLNGTTIYSQVKDAEDKTVINNIDDNEGTIKYIRDEESKNYKIFFDRCSFSVDDANNYLFEYVDLKEEFENISYRQRTKEINRDIRDCSDETKIHYYNEYLKEIDKMIISKINDEYEEIDQSFKEENVIPDEDEREI